MSEYTDKNEDLDKNSRDNGSQSEKPPLSQAAKRALEEAEARRAQIADEAHGVKTRKEIGGREGPDPVRFGDWENGGIASDF